MIENIKNTFIAEATDLIAGMETSVLNLESNAEDLESINIVFRAMHSLKGTAALFGFDNMSGITHHLESIYEKIRDGKEKLTTPLLNCTLKVIDHLKVILKDAELADPENAKEHATLLKEIELLNTNDVNKNNGGDKKENSENLPKQVINTYYMVFTGKPEILQNGTNPIYLMEDLLSLGEGICRPLVNHLPAWEKLEATENYIGFEIIIATVASETEIQDVFLFVENDCQLTLHKISGGNLLTAENKKRITTEFKAGLPVGELKVTEILKPQVSNQKVQKVTNIRVAAERLDEFMNMVSELVTVQAGLSLLSEKMMVPELQTITENVEKITRRLRDNAFTMSLVPIETLVVRYQRLVRDLSAELKKEVLFKTEGTETEIDKSIIEKITDPLLHLIRNALDHGIEQPEERIQKGKNKQGILTLKSYYSGGSVMIEISEDGAGLNLSKIRKKAVQKGIINEDAVISENELKQLIFAPGFSTAEKLSDVSGRGVGMDVVMRNISDLRGEIEIDTVENKGTTFRIRLPLTLSIIDGLLVKIGSVPYIIPLSSVNKCYEVKHTQLVETFNQWITLEGKRTPFLYLREHFNELSTAPELCQLIKVGYNKSEVAIAVDKIVGEYQAVLKPLGEYYKNMEEFSGSTILGDGTVALVMDPNRMIKKYIATTPINH